MTSRSLASGPWHRHPAPPSPGKAASSAGSSTVSATDNQGRPLDELGDTAYWLEGVAPGKIADFAGEAAAQDVDTLSRYGDDKRLALVACLVHTARQQARDDLAEMLCKRVASIFKKAKTELEEIRLRQRAVSERLIGTYRTVLEHLDPDGEAASQEPGQGAARAVAAVEEAGGFAAQMSDIEEAKSGPKPGPPRAPMPPSNAAWPNWS